MDRPQLTGVAIVAAAVVQLLFFAVGIVRRSYWALALPIAFAVAGISALAIWVGWTMMTTEADVPEPEDEAPAS
ncbi:MAG TPA: hypothetical protein VKV26_17420 [Dehalococcoidia bacterium]|nr:hypothetical protein [Dehalococcoidia bacterium]